MKSLLPVVLLTCASVMLAQERPQAQRPMPGIRPNKGLMPPGLRTNSNFRIMFPEVVGAHVLLLSASDKVGTNVLEEAKSQIMMMIRMPVKTAVCTFDGDAVEYAGKVLVEPDVKAVVVVKDNPKAPSLLSLPEQRTAVINPLAYCPDGTDKALSDARMRKMLQRAYCAVLGAPLAPVFGVAELDALHGGIAPSAIHSVFRYGRVLGMERMTPILLDKDGRPVEAGKTPAAPATPSAPANPSALPAVQ